MTTKQPLSRDLNRRTFLGLAAACAFDGIASGLTRVPIVDAHIHLFDTRRPNGVPWPEKNETILYKPALPGRYRHVVAGLDVVGAIAIEASPLFDDNQWLLDLAETDKFIVGIVGDLEPGKPAFAEQLERFQRNPLFRGIRYGDLWGRDFGKSLRNPEFIADLKSLAGAGLELDAFSPGPEVMEHVLRLTDKVPDLRVVINHLGQIDPPAEPQARRAYDSNLRNVAQRTHVYAKVSAVLRRVNGRVPQDLNFYRSRLDEMWGIFGQNRLIYGSDWPNSDLSAPYSQVLSLVRQYFDAKGTVAAQHFFWRNSAAAYRWVRREQAQPNPDEA